MFWFGVAMLPELSEIKKVRKRLGLNQTQLAALAGVSQSLIAKTESGKIIPSYEKAKRIFNSLELLGNRQTAKAKDIMTRSVKFVSENDPVSKAIRIMEKNGFSQLAVIKNQRSVGTISEHTIITVFGKGCSKDPKKTLVKEIMEDSMPVVSEETPASLLSSMLEFEPALLIAKKGRIVGIITKSNLLEALMESKGKDRIAQKNST